MSNCNLQAVSFERDYHRFDDVCQLVENDNNQTYYTTSYYYNLDKFQLTRYSGQNVSAAMVIVCQYDKNYNFVSRRTVGNHDVGQFEIELDRDYLYRFSYNGQRFRNFKGYTCDVGVNTMSRDLAFGSGSSLFGNLSNLTPLFIVVIGFALGFWFLKKIVNKGQKGKTL